MVQLKSTVFFIALLASSFARARPLPHTGSLETRYNELETRAPIATPEGGILILGEGPFARADAFEALDLSVRNIETLEELATRDPKFSDIFKKIFKKIKFFPPSKVTREDAADPLDLSARDLDTLEELAARDPKFSDIFKKIFKKIKLFPPSKVARDGAADPLDLSARDLDMLEELAARNPGFSDIITKFLKKIKFSKSKVTRENAEDLATRDDHPRAEMFDLDAHDAQV